LFENGVLFAFCALSLVRRFISTGSSSERTSTHRVAPLRSILDLIAAVEILNSSPANETK